MKTHFPDNKEQNQKKNRQSQKQILFSKNCISIGYKSRYLATDETKAPELCKQLGLF